MNPTCRICGIDKPAEEFYENRSRRMSTCKDCFKRQQNEKRWMKQYGTTTPDLPQCKRCGKTVHARLSASYCIDGECRAERERERQREKCRRRAVRDAKARAEANGPKPRCKHCGKQLHAWHSSYCQADDCQEEKRQAWWRDNPDKRREYSQRHKIIRKRLMDGAKKDDVTRTGILDRDNWTCQLCGHPIAPDAEYPASNSASWDHIVPLSQGGDHTWANLQAAHLGCNAAKGNRGGPQQLALI